MVEFIGGDRLQAALREIDTSLAAGGSGPQVRVGFLEGVTYADGVTPVASVAAWQEFGTKTIPPRPFFRQMIKKNGPSWGGEIAKFLKATSYDPLVTLARMGDLIKGQLQVSIVALVSPPLSQVTLMLRMMRAKNPALVVTGRTVGEAAARVRAGEQATGVSTKPLIDTGYMLSRVDYEVNT